MSFKWMLSNWVDVRPPLSSGPASSVRDSAASLHGGTVMFIVATMLVAAGLARTHAQTPSTDTKNEVTPAVDASNTVDEREQRRSVSFLSEWALQVQAGPAFPLSPTPFSDHYSTGVAVGAQASTVLSPALHLELAARFQRSVPSSTSDVRALIGASSTTEVEGAELSFIAAGIGARYEVPVSFSVKPHLALRAGGVRTRRASVEDGSGEEALGSSSEFAPWVEATVGARSQISERLSIVVEPVFTTAFTSERTTHSLSIKTGLQVDL